MVGISLTSPAEPCYGYRVRPLSALAAKPPPWPKALFFDLDGTLLAPGARLLRETAEAVWAAAARGSVIVLATGGFSARTLLVAAALQEGARGRVWAITHNGAAIWDPAGRLVCSLATPRPAVEALLGAAGPRVWVAFEATGPGGDTQVFSAGRLRRELVPLLWGPPPERSRGGGGVDGSLLLAHRDGAVAGDGVLPSGGVDGALPRSTAGLPVGLEPRWDWRRARHVARAPGQEVLGCWVAGTPEALAPLDALARGGELLGARYLPWGKRIAQILGRPRLRLVGRDVGACQASKGAAAAWLCDRLGIEAHETAAFGDGDNDVELLDFAGTAVAMANGTAAALAHGHLIAPSNGEHGVARVLHHWLRREPATICDL